MIYALTVGLIAVLIVYVYGLFFSSRRQAGPLAHAAADELFFVFVIPCLNEEAAIGASVHRLINLPSQNYAIVVVDDASDDATAEIVKEFQSDRVWLLSRHLPNARRGKGDVLNAAFNFLLSTKAVAKRPPDKVIMVVIDSDGHLERNALVEVAPFFRDPTVAAVQIGVRMYNVAAGLLARMQDFEFVTFTELFQRSRSRVGTAGLGGNGQFTRLSALVELGDEPWSNCLTEDLDLGLRLICAGWQNIFCATTWVSQQAVTDLRHLVRQRARWFQGHLQCWKRIREFGSIEAPRRAVAGLIHHLLSPVLILVISVPVVVFYATTVLLAASAPGQLAHMLESHGGLAPLMWYGLSFSTVLPFAIVYHLRAPRVSGLRSLFYAHVYIFYNYIWFLAGWIAIWNIALHRQSWVKTIHVSDPRPSRRHRRVVPTRPGQPTRSR